MLVGLVVVGITAHSLAVLAPSGDYFADSLAIGISILALKISRHPRAHPRATLFASLTNVLLLLAAIVIVIIGAIHRLERGTSHIAGLPVFTVSVIAAGVMLLSAKILHPESADLNMRSVMLDTLADAASALGVAVAGGIIFLSHGFYWIAPAGPISSTPR